MLVERQGENGIVNFDNVELIDTEVDDEGSACVFVRCASGKKLVLGWYKNKERADAAMREIVEKREEEIRSRVHKMPRE